MDTVTHVTNDEYNKTIAAAQRFADSGMYINAIRNKRKQKYARDYRDVLLGRKVFADSDGLSTMAAQAVRIHLDEILTDGV